VVVKTSREIDNIYSNFRKQFHWLEFS